MMSLFHERVQDLLLNVTLHRKHELFGVDHRRPFFLALFAAFPLTPPPLALAPQVGAPVHAGNVENCNPLQGDAAQVQSNAITLRKEKKGGMVVVFRGIMVFSLRLKYSTFFIKSPK